jgi:hypothetical protein
MIPTTDDIPESGHGSLAMIAFEGSGIGKWCRGCGRDVCRVPSRQPGLSLESGCTRYATFPAEFSIIAHERRKTL